MKMFEPKRLHPISVIFTIFRYIRELIIPLIVVLLTYVRSNPVWFIPSTIIFLVVLLVFAILHWYRYTYHLQDRGLHIQYGIFVRKKRFIPQERIQTINVSSGVIQRAFGLKKVEVETAGTGSNLDTILTAIDAEVADQLREQLLERTERADAELNEDAETENATQYRLARKDLLIAASTSGSLGVVMSGVAFLFTQIDNIVPELDIYTTILPRFFSTGVEIIVGVIFAIVLVSWLLAIIGTIIKYGGFTITRQGDDIILQRGLLERRQTTISLGRLQAIRMVDGIIRQPFGFVTLYVESAGHGQEGGESTVMYPLLRKRQLQSFMHDMVPELTEVVDELHPVPKRSCIRYMIRAVLPVLIFIIPAAIWIPWGEYALIAIPLLVVLGYFQYRAAGWAIHAHNLLLRYRNINRTTVIVPRRRVQSAALRQSILQRRKRLATYSVSVASGLGGAHFSVVDVDQEEGDQLLDVHRRQAEMSSEFMASSEGDDS